MLLQDLFKESHELRLMKQTAIDRIGRSHSGLVYDYIIEMKVTILPPVPKPYDSDDSAILFLNHNTRLPI